MPNHATISAAEAAAKYGIPKRTILAAIKRGDIPATKHGGNGGVYVIHSTDAKRFAKTWQRRQDRKAAS